VGTVEIVVVGVATATLLWASVVALLCYLLWHEPPMEQTASPLVITKQGGVRAGLAATRRRLSALLGDALGRADAEALLRPETSRS
jgi:hypothetical protein